MISLGNSISTHSLASVRLIVLSGNREDRTVPWNRFQGNKSPALVPSALRRRLQAGGSRQGAQRQNQARRGAEEPRYWLP